LAFHIVLSRRAQTDVRRLRAVRQRAVLDAISRQLSHGPDLTSRHRKPLRPNSRATWELWVDPQRVLYDVDTGAQEVIVRHVYTKAGNRLLDSLGREVDLNEPDG
jgi:mRNA-degrading endonuclease RelE of RelBE toxin-antitoxin system